MTTHKQIVSDTIKLFYQRINAPTAGEKERRRIALLALDQMEPEPSKFTLAGSTIAQVQNAVEAGDVSAADALEFERATDGRKTLIAWLEERT